MTRRGTRTIRAYALVNLAELREIDEEAETQDRSRSEILRLSALAVARRNKAKREGRPPGQGDGH